jgi:hypothetical protein
LRCTFRPISGSRPLASLSAGSAIDGDRQQFGSQQMLKMRTAEDADPAGMWGSLMNDSVRIARFG